MMHSINYSHCGKPKLWYSVPESYREKFEKAIKQRYALLFQKDPNLLFDNITMISPAYLISKGITVNKTLQRPGEFVVTFPGSYHCGFSTGLNVGEAVNFMTKSWFDFGFKCQNIYRATRQRIPVFPIDWVCVENIRNLPRLNLDLETLQALAAAFTKILSNEVSSRSMMEKIIIEKYYQNGEDLEKALIKHIFMIVNRDQIDEDENQCKFCTDLCYLSMVQCSKHTLHDDTDQVSTGDDASQHPTTKL